MTPYELNIAEVEARIFRLEEELVALKAKREELIHNQTVQNKLIPAVANLTPQQKVTLFKDLFRGREDIFAFRWTNKQGRSGYTVACQNEWIPQVCNKPKIKCGECKSRQFKPLTDSTIYDHLSGKITAGVYPLLADDLCYFLAIDLDKSDWQDAVNSIRTTCNQLGSAFWLKDLAREMALTFGSFLKSLPLQEMPGASDLPFSIEQWKFIAGFHLNLMIDCFPTKIQCQRVDLEI